MGIFYPYYFCNLHRPGTWSSVVRKLQSVKCLESPLSFPPANDVNVVVIGVVVVELSAPVR